ARLDLVKALARVEEYLFTRANDRIGRIKALVLRNSINLEDDRRTRNIGHAPDCQILKDDTGLAACHAANKAAVREVLEIRTIDARGPRSRGVETVQPRPLDAIGSREQARKDQKPANNADIS